MSIEKGEAPVVAKAVVQRRLFGTGPFDRYWLNLDCCGLFCALFTYFLHVYGVYAVCWVLLPPWMSYKDEAGTRHLSLAGVFHSLCFVFVAVMAVVSHFRGMTTDPGAVPPDAKPLDEVKLPDAQQEEESLAQPKKLCRRCRSFKPARAHHCSICKRCIIKMDHHCPWLNNCVALGNMKYFALFVGYSTVRRFLRYLLLTRCLAAFLSCIYSLALVVIRFSTCRHNYRRYRHADADPDEACLDKPTQLLTILGLLIEAVLFGMFTSCMMFDQQDVIFSKLTHIDRMKGITASGSIAGINEVFGIGRFEGDTRFQLHWLSPFKKVCFPASVRDEIMGFCRPCVNRMSTTVNSPRSAGGTELTAVSAIRPEMI